jgi:hypothetical protein
MLPSCLSFHRHRFSCSLCRRGRWRPRAVPPKSYITASCIACLPLSWVFFGRDHPMNVSNFVCPPSSENLPFPFSSLNPSSVFRLAPRALRTRCTPRFLQALANSSAVCPWLPRWLTSAPCSSSISIMDVDSSPSDTARWRALTPPLDTALGSAPFLSSSSSASAEVLAARCRVFRPRRSVL